jgi:hypothetical protein
MGPAYKMFPIFDIAAKRRKMHKNQISGIVNSMCYNAQKSKFRLFTSLSSLIPIYFSLTLIAAFRTPENGLATIRTDVPGLFIFNPLFGSPFFTIRDGSQNDFLSHRYRKVLDKLAGEIITFVTARITFLFIAVFYGTHLAKKRNIIG